MVDRLRVGWLKRGRYTRQEDVEVSPAQSRMSPSKQRILREKRHLEAGLEAGDAEELEEEPLCRSEVLFGARV